MTAVTLGELSYQAAVRALDLQERSLDQLRSRAGTVLAAASLTASFLGAQTIQHQSTLGAVGVLALIALAISIVSCLYVLLPKERFVFSVNAPQMYNALFEVSDDLDEIHRRLAFWFEQYWAANQTIIDDLGRYFAVAAFALILQLMLWCVALAGTIA